MKWEIEGAWTGEEAGFWKETKRARVLASKSFFIFLADVKFISQVMKATRQKIVVIIQHEIREFFIRWECLTFRPLNLKTLKIWRLLYKIWRLTDINTVLIKRKCFFLLIIYFMCGRNNTEINFIFQLQYSQLKSVFSANKRMKNWTAWLINS